MRTICLHDRATIADVLRQNAAMRLYELGDLDDFFWPSTTWYALADDVQIYELALAYNAGDLLILLAHPTTSTVNMRMLLESIRHLLPRRFYSHLGPDLADVLQGYSASSHGLHDKMALINDSQLDQFDTSAVVQLRPGDQAEVQEFYRTSYPGNWFDPRMLETGQYYGYREQGQLLSAAGVHVYSASQRVAALGNITTHPAARGRGLATIVTARLCKELCATVDQIGLNVRSDNQAAINCYRRLGFERIGAYEEFMFES
ncbi:MAG: GNAT family N-acetyltransferase [Roseiflexaceae bacterium]|nr:GNAT family N-acetyltransferase [Roseiflexaceae bacterium]